MILVFSEDGGLFVANGLEAVQRECEGIDVLSGVYRFYDAQGRALKPVFDRPVKERRFLGYVRTVDSGSYHLEIDSSFEQDPLWVAFVEAEHLSSAHDRFATIESLKSFLREGGVEIDGPIP